MKRKKNNYCIFQTTFLFAGIFISQLLFAQTKIDLTNMNAFKHAGANWQIVGNVYADPGKKSKLTIKEGTGIIANLPGAAHENLTTAFEHGDMDVELDYMMAKSSNSGIYLQGRYEVQLLDSWEVLNPGPGDNGGIYERWDDTRLNGQKGYEGAAPRQNVSRAPGLWQHLKISFQAPRFEAGKKIENARMLRVELNGVLIHENEALTGPTRSSMAEDEVASAPLLIQGDHGEVAFRNIVYTKFDQKGPWISSIKYSVFKGKFEKEPDYKKLIPVIKNNAIVVSSAIAGLPKNQFLVRYTGVVNIQEAGEYLFFIKTEGGSGVLKINNSTVIPWIEENGKASAVLQPGALPFEFIYSKQVDWPQAFVNLSVSGSGLRQTQLADAGIISNGGSADPILINAEENKILRSFMDLPGGTRVTHSVNVGSPDNVHYTYDLNKGTIIQVWRGGFLDATPMWNNRGDGSSRPVGAIQYFGNPVPAIEKLGDDKAVWSKDTLGSGFRPKGYVLDDKGRPSFKYVTNNAFINDAVRVLENRQGIQRTIQITNAPENLYMLLAEDIEIEALPDNLYLIGDKAWYLKIQDAGGAMPVIRKNNGRSEMIIPVKSKLVYSILF